MRKHLSANELEKSDLVVFEGWKELKKYIL